MENGKMTSHVSPPDLSARGDGSLNSQTPISRSFSHNNGPITNSALIFKSNVQPQPRSTFANNSIWVNDGFTNNRPVNGSCGVPKRTQNTHVILPDLTPVGKAQVGNRVSPTHDRFSQTSPTHSTESPEQTRTGMNGASPWHANPRSNLSGPQSIFSGFNDTRTEIKRAEKVSHSPVATNGSDLLDGSAPDVDGVDVDVSAQSWRVSTGPGFPQAAGYEHQTARNLPQNDWLLSKEFGTTPNTGFNNSLLAPPYTPQLAVNGATSFTPVVGNHRNKTIAPQLESFYQHSGTGVGSLNTTQTYLQKPGMPLDSTNVIGLGVSRSGHPFVNGSASNNHHFGSNVHHQANSQVPYPAQGGYEATARQSVTPNFAYLHVDGLNVSYPYDAPIPQGFVYDNQRLYSRRVADKDRDTLSPATSDYPNSWRSPGYSSSITPLTGPNSARSHSGYGYGPRSVAHDPMLLERKLRDLDLQSREPHYSMTPTVMNPARHHHLSYAAGMRMNPMAHPYVSSHFPPVHAINHPNSAYGRFGAREQENIPGNRSALLDEFRSQHRTGKRYELKDIYGHVVEFSGDQHGSRFIQEKLQTANSDEKERVFAEIQPNAIQLMTDVFGNYVIQKLFEHGSQTQKKILANQMKGRILSLSLQMYGCRVVQKALEHVLVDQQASIVKELEGVETAVKVIMDGNGNHVIQKAIERVPGEYIQFIVDAHRGQVSQLASHAFGCRVIQRILEYCQPHAKRAILDELHSCVPLLITNQFGNYVVQHLIQNGDLEDRRRVIDVVQQQLLVFSKHKFASNVVEKSLEYAEADQRAAMLKQLTTPNAQGQTPVLGLLRDQYGNYVIQKVFAQLHGAERDALLDEIKNNMVQLRRTSYGKQINAIEKLIIESDMLPSLAHSSETSTAPSVQSNGPNDERLGTCLPSLLSPVEKDDGPTNSDAATITN